MVKEAKETLDKSRSVTAESIKMNSILGSFQGKVKGEVMEKLSFADDRRKIYFKDPESGVDTSYYFLDQTVSDMIAFTEHALANGADESPESLFELFCSFVLEYYSNVSIAECPSSLYVEFRRVISFNTYSSFFYSLSFAERLKNSPFQNTYGTTEG